MTDFQTEKERARINYTAWSGGERDRLLADPEARRNALRTGAIVNLTPDDREAVVNGRTKTSGPELKADMTRQPLPLTMELKPVPNLEPVHKRELRSAIYWSLGLWASVIVAAQLINSLI